MKTASPLRYPGGKSAMADLLRGIRTINRLGGYDVAEPFAGGAGASLSLLYQEDTQAILINDADQAIHDFWWTIVNRPSPFIAMMKSKRVSMAEWRRQKQVYQKNSGLSRLQRGFSAFYLNRCNRSGIIMNGGVIGGVKQTGKWKLNARFNKQELERRCRKVSEYSDRISVSQLDAIHFICSQNSSSTFFFIDPPYYGKGETLYLNRLDHEYHERLASLLRSMEEAAWVVTYDDCPEIRAMYSDWATVRPFALRYSASDKRKGCEILIAPKWMDLPAVQKSAAIAW